MSEFKLSRLYYASTATEVYLHHDIGKILKSCQTVNPSLNVTGMLFFGEGYFLQCLEGSRENINFLYRKIARDPRHKDVELLEFKDISERYFEEWSMKYVSSANVIFKILKQTGLRKFNPYLLDSYTLNAMTEVFRDYVPIDKLETGVPNVKKRSFSFFNPFRRV
jgi:hypothetical protein